MILAAGRGERMRPLTDHTPKPLLEVGGKPLIVWHIERLRQAGIVDIVINIAHLGYRIPERLGDGSRWGVRIVYSDEQEEGGLETLGGIVKALPLLGNEPFWVINGDVFCDYPVTPHCTLAEGIKAHLVLVANPPHHPRGDFDLSEGRVLDRPRYTYAGIGVYDPSLFASVPQGKRPLAPLLREAMGRGEISGEYYDGLWVDVGTPDRLSVLDRRLRVSR